ncbi:MAG: hypothetical protein QQN62_01955 [Nitrosopumilus sp.]
MRFIMIGIVLVFVGFIILAVFGHNYQASTLESNEFETCFKYSTDNPPVEINCSLKVIDQILFFVLVIGFIGAGIIALIKGVKGNWDSKIKPEDMVGPGRRDNED